MTEVKVCGVTSPEDAELACNLGADMVGVIVRVDVQTPRELNISKARRILDCVPSDTKTVLVTMPNTVEEALDLLAEIETDYVQVHSSLPPSELSDLEDRCDRGLIGVLSLSSTSEYSFDLKKRAERTASIADVLLIDSLKSTEGKTYSRTIADHIIKNLSVPVILAGGLSPSNVRNVLENVDPFGVDVASGVESKPGIKDEELMRRFIRRVKG